MVVGEASIHNIMGGMTSTGGVRLHNHKRKLKQRFDIIKKLGQGTYGKVQLGINKETGQEVAIKTIKKCKIETEADLIRIRREIQIMSSVQHPNIIHIYEVFENREKMVLVMEYAAGGELYDYLSERKVLTEQEARRIFRQIATAVFYCHKHKICHRDLKLENILLDQVGNAKIADFGLSNVFDEQRLLNTFCGSPLYASPEIVKGTPYHGPEVDCWSLGVLLYTLVYGAMPFDGSNFKRLVKQISQSDYFEPKKPSPASPLIKDMLTVSPAKRADIERICTHWWVNEDYEQNCLDIAEELAAQTPVRLDLLLSLVPQSASAEKLVVGDQQPAVGDVANSVSSETLVPTRCHSVGSLMELDRDSSDRRIREMLEEDPRTPTTGSDAKRKLETTPSMDETAAAGAKRKDRPKRREKKEEERDARAYKSASRHHSAPIPNSITEEAMEVDPAAAAPIHHPAVGSPVEPIKTDACLDQIEESGERSPSKERGKTPAALEQEQTPSKSREQIERESKASAEPASPLLEGAAASVPLESATPNEVATANERLENAGSASREAIDLEETRREFKKLREKALSLDSELSTGQSRETPAKTYERRRSKIFETAEKFNQMAAPVENEKPKKIFIPGVNVGGAKRVFERKASLSSSSVTLPPPAKAVASKVIIDVAPSAASATSTAPEAKRNDGPSDAAAKQPARNEEEEERKKKKEEAKKRAVDIITGAIGKPPVQRRVNGSPPVSPSSQEPKKLPLKIPVGANDSRTATVSVSTPVETKFSFDDKTTEADSRFAVTPARPEASVGNEDDAQPEEPKVSSKMEITLKSATLPRPRKTSKAEISLAGVKSPGGGMRDAPVAFKSEVEAKIDAFHPQRLRTQRSEVAFPVAAAVPQANRSSSLEPEGRPKSAGPKERIIPIQVEADHRQSQHSSTPPPSKPPLVPQRSLSQRSGSLSRQSTADSDTDSALGSTVGPEPIRKSPREYIIPIAVEGGGYVTPRSGSVEPESKTSGSTPSSASGPRSRFGRPRRMSSLLSDASEDESPFSSLHRDSEDLLQRHMHRLRSSRPSRQPPEHADSLSSGEDDDDDGFELLTAENLFSTLLSRVRSLTQRLNVDDNRAAGFPSSRLFGRLGSNSSQAFWGINKPLSRRLSESQFRHSLSREGDVFSRKDSTNSSSSNPGTPSSPGTYGASSRETVLDIGSNTLPRDKVAREDVEAEPTRFRKETQDALEQSFTPSLARRLSRTLIEQTRRSLTRSPSASYDSRGQSPGAEAADRSLSTVSDQTEYKERSGSTGRAVARAARDSPRRSVSLLEDEGSARASSLDRWYKEPGFVGRSTAGKLRKESFRAYRADKIQEETPDDAYSDNRNESTAENGSVSEYTCSASVCDATSSLSAKSYETSPTESSSNIGDYKPAYKSDPSRNFEDRLLAAENLIKESKLRNLGLPASGKLDPNLTSSYRDTDKCDKRSLTSITEAGSGSALSKRRSCIPSLRLRSGSLTREASAFSERRKSLADPRHVAARAFSPEKSLLSKLFKSASTREADSKEEKEDAQKSKQRRISRFLRPDFFDTPREESRYAKEKEAQKAAENERRKSRFIRRKAENGKAARAESVEQEKKREKELKNEINSLKRERRSRETEERAKSESPDEGSRNGFLHSLEKKLERLRSADGGQPEKEKEKRREAESASAAENETADGDPEKGKGKKKKKEKEKAVSGTANGRVESDALRERSAPPVDCRPANDCRAPAKRAASVEDLSPASKSSQPSPRSRVSSMLGLFKTTDAKHSANGTRPRAAALMSKLKRTSPTKSATASVDEASSSNGGGGSKIPTKHVSPDLKSTAKRSSASKSPKSSPPKDGEKGSEEKLADRNGEEESGRSIGKGKKASRSSMENGSAATEPGNPEDAERKAKKLTKKLGGSAEGSDADGSRKKRIVRVAKKATKKGSEGAGGVGDGSRATSEEQEKEKEKSTKARATKKKSGIAEANGAAIPTKNGKAKENGVEARSSGAGEEAIAPEAKGGQPPKQQESHRASRSNLKLDLSKIPQHSFRSSAPKSDSPRAAASDRSPDKPTDGAPSKVTPRAILAAGKTATDKPLRAKDVAELKREVTECARIIESRADSAPGSRSLVASVASVAPAAEEAAKPEIRGSPENQPASCLPKQLSSDRATDLLSPTGDEAESFDSWSISSAELSHARPDLHSPTSPSPSMFPRGDGSESVIDRIRRRSFYSRFNDRRKSSLTAPPPGVSLPSSATLPRKFSFTGLHRDHQQRDRGKYATGYGSTAKPEQVVGRRPIDRSYSLYGDGSVAVARNRSLDRGRYSADPKSPSLYSSSYDPLRRYLRSPTFDLSVSRSRYHSADFAANPDLASCSSCYRSSHSSLLSDAPIDSSAFSTLPRKYGASFSEPKTVEYYEELLAPSSADYYLPSRRSPASSEYRKRSVESPGAIRSERTVTSDDDDDDDSREEKRGEGGAGKETGPAPSTTGRPGDY